MSCSPSRAVWAQRASRPRSDPASSSARLIVGELAHGTEPWTTLVVNVVGCFLIGLAAARLSGLARVGLATGVLGGFTTMSAFAVEANQLADAGSSAAAVSYVIASVVLGVGAAWVGRRLARRTSESSA